MTELNAIIGQQQLQAQHLSHAAHGPPVQLPPHPSGLQPPGLPPVTGSSSGLLALGALGSQAHLAVKDEKNHHDLDHRGENEGSEAVGKDGKRWPRSYGQSLGILQHPRRHPRFQQECTWAPWIIIFLPQE
ncbi:PREDICTED: transducin-like enhancer protein 3 [Calidris pugnax]|uniref:transducin-like enhancer protein 3 n=1 Tax=Calidris pugnax TaxID=198806 RepID=UPI00071DC396|nr:PREDICTED: transducin-like enhancer protein 3 [Calidris pugnax]